jgi:hypothetical protein
MINARFNALILFTLQGAGKNNIGVDLSPVKETPAMKTKNITILPTPHN